MRKESGAHHVLSLSLSTPGPLVDILSDSVHNLPLGLSHTAVNVVVLVEVNQRITLSNEIAHTEVRISPDLRIANARLFIRLAPHGVVVRSPVHAYKLTQSK